MTTPGSQHGDSSHDRPTSRRSFLDYLTENAYGNPFWSEASMMLTDRGHMCRCNAFRLCMAGGERAQWFGDKATLYMPAGGCTAASSGSAGVARARWPCRSSTDRTQATARSPARPGRSP